MRRSDCGFRYRVRDSPGCNKTLVRWAVRTLFDRQTGFEKFFGNEFSQAQRARYGVPRDATTANCLSSITAENANTALFVEAQHVVVFRYIALHSR